MYVYVVLFQNFFISTCTSGLESISSHSAFHLGRMTANNAALTQSEIDVHVIKCQVSVFICQNFDKYAIHFQAKASVVHMPSLSLCTKFSSLDYNVRRSILPIKLDVHSSRKLNKLFILFLLKLFRTPLRKG